ncbi:hypothetical protein BDZ89DRAFT_1059611 [Hymenopellis radicata]|nr:hypothetical protein BDZ89DRAFT_1059611 [Hymenopellis radicata]
MPVPRTVITLASPPLSLAAWRRGSLEPTIIPHNQQPIQPFLRLVVSRHTKVSRRQNQKVNLVHSALDLLTRRNDVAHQKRVAVHELALDARGAGKGRKGTTPGNRPNTPCPLHWMCPR